MEWIKHTLLHPDSPSAVRGPWDKLEAEEIADGQLKGKLALYGITPVDDSGGVYPQTAEARSPWMEVNTSFATNWQSVI